MANRLTGPLCGCRRGDAWRCAVEQNLTGQITCHCRCHRPVSLSDREQAAELATALSGLRGWAIRHADGKRWRTMDSLGMPEWTDDQAKALVCRLRVHVEAYAQDDPDDVRIVEVDW